VVTRISALLKAERFGLVETVAERTAQLLLEGFRSPRVRISVTKLGVLREAKKVGVCIERTRSAAT
jgi:dihydroneopterin aldolase